MHAAGGATSIRYYGGLCVAIAGLAVAGLLVACGGSRQALDAGPMLQDVSTNSVTVVWWHSRAESAALTLRDPSGQLRRVPAQRVGTRFEARPDGLQPSTSYGYWVECGARGRDNPQAPGRFRTAPLPGRPFSFLVFGDSGSGKASQYRLAAVMNRQVAELALHTGDLVYNIGERNDYPAPWAGGSRPPDAKIRDILVPAIEAGGADVVFCGHNHLYERSHPLRAGRVWPTNGVLYVTSAAGEKSLHEEKHGTEPHIAFFNDTKFSFTVVKMNGPRLELMQISEDDEILDKVIVNKEPASTPILAVSKKRFGAMGGSLDEATAPSLPSDARRDLRYALWRRDPVFILGQSVGLAVYTRNLILIHAKGGQNASE